MPDRTRIYFEKKYSILSFLGQWGYGKVYSGQRISDGKSVVIKILPKNPNGTMEIFLLQKTRHISGVINIIEYFDSLDDLKIVLECMKPQNNEIEIQDLFDFISGHLLCFCS